MIIQGLVFMLIGMVTVFIFLGLLVFSMNFTAYLLKFFPEKEADTELETGAANDNIAVVVAAVINYR